MQFVVFNSHVEVVRGSRSVAVPFGWWEQPNRTAAEYVANVFEDMFHPSEAMPADDRDRMDLCRWAVLELMTEDEARTVAMASMGDLDPAHTDEQHAEAVARYVAQVGEVFDNMEEVN